MPAGPSFDTAPDGTPYGVDGNGNLTERTQFGGHEVIIHYADIPESDVTTRYGIRVTTPLRTVIDLAPEVSPDELDAMVADCLRRRLFTTQEAWRRLREPDMTTNAGASLLRRLLPPAS